MKDIIIYINDFNKELITSALESGFNKFMVEELKIKENIEKLGKVEVVLKKNFEIYEYQNQKDEEKILKLSKKKNLILTSKSWEIIPWENLVAKGANFYVIVDTIEKLKTALGVLEKGVSGIIIKITSLNEIKEFAKEIFSIKNKIILHEAEIVDIKILSSGERVCVDTCNIMNIGEGMLVGNSSNCLFLVHSESIENPYCAPRPFRVNAGAVHSYIKVDLDKTKYLYEINSGDSVLIVNYKGEIRKGIVGRSKIELRPLILITARIEENIYSVILQNAETINLVKKDGKPLSVSKLKTGDKVLVNIEKGARHFGIKIEEKIIEK